MAGVDKVRIDKWLWAVRLYHTRSLAIQACTAGHVKIEDERVKPARPVRPGEVITVLAGGVPRTVRVRALLERRVGAKLVPDYLEDLTPPEVYARAREEAKAARLARSFGRPTKLQRRLWERMP